MHETYDLNQTYPGWELQLIGGKPVGWIWDYQEQIQLAVRTELELGVPELQVQHSNHSNHVEMPDTQIVFKHNKNFLPGEFLPSTKASM